MTIALQTHRQVKIPRLANKEPSIHTRADERIMFFLNVISKEFVTVSGLS